MSEESRGEREELIHALAEEQRRRGWNDVRLSERSGISTATISRIKAGQNDPTLETLAQLARALGYTLRDFLLLAVSRPDFEAQALLRDFEELPPQDRELVREMAYRLALRTRAAAPPPDPPPAERSLVEQLPLQ